MLRHMPRRATASSKLLQPRFMRNLVAFREEAGWSRDDAAARMGITSTYLRLLEKGDRSIPSADVLSKIATAYGRSIDDLLSEAPGPAVEERRPAVIATIALSREDAALVAEQLAVALQEIEEINRRILTAVRDARARQRNGTRRKQN